VNLDVFPGPILPDCSGRENRNEERTCCVRAKAVADGGGALKTRVIDSRLCKEEQGVCAGREPQD
jgi:hypothetical protein